MSCEEFEQKILDYQEEGLSPIQRQEVETHLAECATCRSFAREWQRLDRALSVQIEAPALSADFDRRLRERIHGASQPMPEAERAERKRQMQAEFESGIARLRRGSFALGNVLTHLVWPLAATLAGWLTWILAAPLIAQLSAHDGSHPLPDELRWLIACAIFLAVALAEKTLRPGKIFGSG